MSLGISICENYLCLCGKQVENRGIQGLSCRHSAARISRHNMVSDIVWKVMQMAKFKQQRNYQVYYDVTTSVQTVSRLYCGSKVNVWHGM